MIFDPANPPKGTVRDWLDARATADGIAVVFPETSETLTWRSLRDDVRDMAQKMAARGVDKGESVAIICGQWGSVLMNKPRGIIRSSSETNTSFKIRSREFVPRIPSGSDSPCTDSPTASLDTTKIIVSSWRGSTPSKISVQTME